MQNTPMCLYNGVTSTKYWHLLSAINLGIRHMSPKHNDIPANTNRRYVEIIASETRCNTVPWFERKDYVSRSFSVMWEIAFIFWKSKKNERRNVGDKWIPLGSHRHVEFISEILPSNSQTWKCCTQASKSFSLLQNVIKNTPPLVFMLKEKISSGLHAMVFFLFTVSITLHKATRYVKIILRNCWIVFLKLVIFVTQKWYWITQFNYQ